MDWSLVLLSQGIETVIIPATEEHGWQLAVQDADYPKAIQALQDYHRENRFSAWQQPLPWTGLTFDWRAIIWFTFLAFVFALGAAREPAAWREAGLMDSQAVARGEWWRLFTAVTLHANLNHLLANATTGSLFLGLAMAAFGSGHALLGSFLAGAGANALGFLLYTGSHRGLGASGMVMGALGLLVAHSFELVRAGLGPKKIALRALIAGCLILVLVGFDPETDVLAHSAGFALGCVLGVGLVCLAERPAQNELSNRLCEVITAALVVLTWWLALR